MLIPISLVCDILTETVFETGGLLAFIRAIFYYSVILFALISGRNASRNVAIIFGTFVLYILILIPFSNNPLESTRISLKVLMSILMFPVGYYIVGVKDRITILNRSIVITMVLYILNYIISQAYGIGVSDYTKGKDFLFGSLSDSWNNITYMLLVTPLILKTFRNKSMVYVLVVILGILLIISLKRIAIAGVLFGYMIYVIKTGQLMRGMKHLGFFCLLFILCFPFLKTTLLNRFEARGTKLNGGNPSQIIEQEGRYLETFAVWSEIISIKKPLKALFGLQPFYSVGNYGSGAFGDRQLHVDYNLIVNTTGIVGLWLYLRLFYKIYLRHKARLKFILRTKQNSDLIAVFYVLLLSQFLTSFGGQMYAFTFRAIIFIYLGTILRMIEMRASFNKK